jgi:tripartite-type tricarboxylate transporter receptor subunit TctC
MKMLTMLAGALLAAMPLGAVHAADPAYPNKPIRFVVPYTPGGSTDILGRLIGERLGKRLGQPVVVENRAGAAGMLGSDAVAKSAADGYTILIGSVANTIHPYTFKKMPFNLDKDLVPVAQFASVPNFLVVNSASPIMNVQQLIAAAKAKPGTLSFASTGAGATPHLSGEAFKSMAGIDLVHVPYKGSGPALADVLGGQVTMTFDNSALPLVKAGQLRALAVTTPKRSSAAPDIPTMAESGLPGYDITSWYGAWAPAGTPPEILKLLHSEINAILAMPDVKERMLTLGADPVIITQPQFADYVRDEQAKWKKLIQDSGMKIEM